MVDYCINKYINVNVKHTIIDDFKQHLYLIILDKPGDWILTRNSLTASVIAIVRNQNRVSSPYRQMYKPVPEVQDIVQDEIVQPDEDRKVLDTIGNFIDDYFYRNIKPDAWILFKLHYYENLKLKDVAKKVGINYQVTRLKIKGVMSELKKQLPDLNEGEKRINY